MCIPCICRKHKVMVVFGDVQEEKPVLMAEAKKLLDEIKNNLNHEQKLTYDYLSKFTKLSYEEAQKLLEELKALNIPRMRDKILIKIVDILPLSLDELRALLVKENITVSREDMKRILELVSKYYKESKG